MNTATPDKYRPANTVLALVVLLFPVIVYMGLERFGVRILGLSLAFLLLLRLVLARVSGRSPLMAGSGSYIALAGVVLAGMAAVSEREDMLLFYPVIVNAVLFVLFAVSLYRPPSLVERFARLRGPDLPPEASAYTRVVTKVWCGFFVLNGTVALGLALLGDLEAWTLYNGLIAYLLMGGLLGGEVLVRRVIRNRGAF